MQKYWAFIACLLLSVTVKAQTVDTTSAITDIYITQNGKRVEIINGKCLLKRKPFEIVIELVEDGVLYSDLSPDSTELYFMKALPKTTLDTLIPHHNFDYYSGIAKRAVIIRDVKYIYTPITRYNMRKTVGKTRYIRKYLRRCKDLLFLSMLYYKLQLPTTLAYSQFIKIEWVK